MLAKYIPILGTFIGISMTLTLLSSGVDTTGSDIHEESAYRLPAQEQKAEQIVMSVEDTVKAYFSDIPDMIQVARCESHYTHMTKDGILRGKVNKSDIGVMQINTFYHLKEAEGLGIDLYTLEGNMAYARHLYEKSGTQPWSASSKCWSPHIAKN